MDVINQPASGYCKALVDTITRSIHATTWDRVGAPGSIAPVFLGPVNLLVVRQTSAVQEEVAGFLTRPELHKPEAPVEEAPAE